MQIIYNTRIFNKIIYFTFIGTLKRTIGIIQCVRQFREHNLIHT